MEISKIKFVDCKYCRVIRLSEKHVPELLAAFCGFLIACKDHALLPISYITNFQDSLDR
jgi:hypothetical protein